MGGFLLNSGRQDATLVALSPSRGCNAALVEWLRHVGWSISPRLGNALPSMAAKSRVEAEIPEIHRSRHARENGNPVASV